MNGDRGKPGPDHLDQARPEAALLTVRLFWGMALASLVACVVGIHMIWRAGRLPAGPPSVVRVVTLLAVGLLVVLVPSAYVARGQTYKRHWRGDAIAPGGYILGNLLLIAACQVVAVVSLVAVLIGHSYWPGAIPGLVAVVVLLVNLPDGRVMRPSSR